MSFDLTRSSGRCEALGPSSSESQISSRLACIRSDPHSLSESQGSLSYTCTSSTLSIINPRSSPALTFTHHFAATLLPLSFLTSPYFPSKSADSHCISSLASEFV